MAKFRLLQIEIDDPAGDYPELIRAVRGPEPIEAPRMIQPLPIEPKGPAAEAVRVTMKRNPRKEMAKHYSPASKAAAPAPKPSAPADLKEPSTPQRVLEMIRKGPPRTSGEIFTALGKQGYTGAIAPVYQACKVHKEKGLIESRPDDSTEGGGVAKWYPVKGK